MATVFALGASADAQRARASATLVHLPAADADPPVVGRAEDLDTTRHMAEREVCLESSLYVVALEAYRHDVLAAVVVFPSPQQSGDSPLTDLVLDRDASGWAWNSFSPSTRCVLIRTMGGRSRLFRVRLGVDFGGPNVR